MLAVNIKTFKQRSKQSQGGTDTVRRDMSEAQPKRMTRASMWSKEVEEGELVRRASRTSLNSIISLQPTGSRWPATGMNTSTYV